MESLLFKGLEVSVREEEMGFSLEGLSLGIGIVGGEEALIFRGNKDYYIPLNQIDSIDSVEKGISIYVDDMHLGILNGGDPRLYALRHYLLPKI